MEDDSLEPGEAHPIAYNAYEYIKGIPVEKMVMYIESLSSTALSGNRTAKLCMGTIHRLQKDQPVSDRYLLALAWMIKMMEEKHDSNNTNEEL